VNFLRRTLRYCNWVPRSSARWDGPRTFLWNQYLVSCFESQEEGVLALKTGAARRTCRFSPYEPGSSESFDEFVAEETEEAHRLIVEWIEASGKVPPGAVSTFRSTGRRGMLGLVFVAFSLL